MSEQIVSKEERLRIAKRFADKVLEKYGKIVKSIVIMGSVVREDFKPFSDIDVFLIIDDLSTDLVSAGTDIMEVRDKIDEDIEKIAKEISELLSVQPSYTITEFTDYARTGHPIIYNFLKEGIAIYDVGFFDAWKKLLLAGKISGTREAIENYMEGAPKKLQRAKTVKLLMLAEDCYYAILNTAQAVLMFLGIPPPPPSKCYDEFVRYLVEPKIVEAEFANWLKEIIEIRKKIEHQELLNVSGSFVDEWLEKSEKFIKKMFEIISVLEVKKLEKIAEKTYEVMLKSILSGLNVLEKLNLQNIENMELKEINSIIEEKFKGKIDEVFRKKFIESKLMREEWMEVFNRVSNNKKLVEEGKIYKIPAKEIYDSRELVRKLIREISKAIEKSS
ncbi:MAG: nucleotidyltransferase domain-containing protein [Candidatus Aenigmarchaeota archaeon]|nr:nucleotidyltransferase domain-containing protein [Candidatus Aenigmarchaeota archaeon]MDW8149611.1 nucleotidyltransferase domain-containing protein [Candidatus Aenigmarchaeota archaeon]